MGYFAYDLGRQIERLPESTADDQGLPDIWLGFYDVLLAIDHANGAVSLVVGAPDGREAEAAAKARRWAQALKASLPLPSLPTPPAAGPVRSSFTKARYIAAVEKALAYIRAGDIFQVNLAQRFACPYGGTGWQLYRRLREASPAPFAAFLDAGSWQVASSSPERFITVQEQLIETRPIKGTRPRGATPEEDRRNAGELLASEKDAAELVMIVDLQRNDLGRVCEYGSVRVPDLQRLEATPNVWHTVATVEGRLRPGVTTAQILKATFPGGSITGAPKVRAMEIIEELEPVRRGVYTGAIGYIGFDGRIDLNIAIRTAVVKEGVAYFHAGGGIVADSDPQAEYGETLAKGSGIARALGVSLRDLPGVMRRRVIDLTGATEEPLNVIRHSRPPACPASPTGFSKPPHRVLQESAARTENHHNMPDCQRRSPGYNQSDSRGRSLCVSQSFPWSSPCCSSPWPLFPPWPSPTVHMTVTDTPTSVP